MAWRLLLTRPRREAEAFAAEIAGLGIEALIEPMLDIQPQPAPVPLEGVQALLATSTNGVRALAAATSRRDLPLLAVGDSTAAAAREAGFAEVASAAGDVRALADLIRERLHPGDGALLHAAAREVAGDLGGMLAPDGFAYRRVVLYRAEPASALSEAARRALLEARLDGAAFFSPRSAAAFVRLVEQAALMDRCAPLVAFCLSPAVATAAAPLPWRRVRVADHPDPPALLRLLREELEQA